MLNEIIFLIYCLLVCTSAITALYLGKEYIISLVSLFSVLLNFLILKEINLFGLTATACDALGVGIILSLNLIQEFYGYAKAKKTIWISFFCSIFYLIITQLHTLYLPSLQDISSCHYNFLLNPAPRIIIASLGVYLFVQHLESKLYKFLSSKFSKSNIDLEELKNSNRKITRIRAGIFKSKFLNFILRNYTSVAITQLIDTILFSFLGLYKLNAGLSSISVILEIILISYTIKIITILISVPFLSITKKIITYP